jgi:hypothetical protein
MVVEGSMIRVGYQRDQNFPDSVRYVASARSDDTPFFNPEIGQVSRTAKQRTALMAVMEDVCRPGRPVIEAEKTNISSYATVWSVSCGAAN